MAHLETVQRIYSIQTEGLDIYNYWDRLKLMKLQSVQRHQESYRVIYLWKIVMGLVPNYEISWNITDKRGLILDIPKSNYKHSTMAKK